MYEFQLGAVIYLVVIALGTMAGVWVQQWRQGKDDEFKDECKETNEMA